MGLVDRIAQIVVWGVLCSKEIVISKNMDRSMKQFSWLIM